MPKAKPKALDTVSIEEKRLLAAGASTELRQHDSVILDETMQAGIRVARVISECIIDRYHNRMQINDRQWTAGMQLRRLWMRAVHPAAVTSSYGEQRGNGGGDGTGIDARQTLRVTLEEAGLARRYMSDAAPLKLTETNAVIWMERYPTVVLPAGEVAMTVCGLDEWAGGTQRLMLLRDALTALAEYWKITGDEEISD